MANSWDTCGEEKSQVNLEGQCRAGSSLTVQLMLQGWFKCDAPLEQNQVVTELWSHNCWVSDTAQLSATQTANTNMVRAEQHLRMNQFSPSWSLLKLSHQTFSHSYHSRSVHLASGWLPRGEAGRGMLPASCAISPVTRRNYFILLQVLKRENSNS